MEIYRDGSKDPRERAQDLLSRMTLREKVGQINQRLYGFNAYERKGEEIVLSKCFTAEVEYFGGLGVLYGLYRADPWSKKNFETGIFGKDAKRTYNTVQKYVIEHSRFGVPALISSECPHGHQALDGYLLPVNLAVGATWNPALLRRAYNVCGRQLKELGVDYSLMSMLDILRDPRWGRSEECYSEDPFLAASFARQAVRGCQEAGVPVVAKHFCGQGETTGGINASAARIGGRELREIHLPAMKACCQEGVQGVMAAYNEIDGEFCHGNKALLQDILRGEMRFTGEVMSDGCAIDKLNLLTGDSAASGAMALGAGINISLWDQGFAHLDEAVERGLISEETLDRAVLRVLERKFAQGLFEHPYLDETVCEDFSYEKYPESLEIARESAVLLKNDGILPLDPNDKNISKLAVIGPNADSVYNQLGDYTPAQRDGVCVTLLRGMQEKWQGCVRFTQGCTVCGNDGSGIPAAAELAGESDLVILALGGSSSRFAGARFDTNGAAIMDGPVEMDCGEGIDARELELPGMQEELAEAVFAQGKPVVTVVIAGRPYAIPKICEKSRAVLYAFYPGPMGGQALAELLTGELSPSGRLPASLPNSAGQLPCYYNYKSSYVPGGPVNLYPFGYGLSFTEFAIDQVRFPKLITTARLLGGERAEIHFALRNVGKSDAWAVPQLFIRDVLASTVRRVRELKAFDKVFLHAGEEKQCSLTLGADELSLWNQDMDFCLEPGDFKLFLEEGGRLYAEGIFTVT